MALKGLHEQEVVLRNANDAPQLLRLCTTISGKPSEANCGRCPEGRFRLPAQLSASRYDTRQRGLAYVEATALEDVLVYEVAELSG